MLARTIIAWLWSAFAVIWLVLAAFSKKRSRRSPWSFWGLRLLLIAAVIAVIRLQPSAHSPASRLRHFAMQPGPPARWTGVALCIAGFALAFWARACIGRNWGPPMSLREGHELVTSGPYRYVRHPIYSGIMLAMIGTAIGSYLLWLAVFVVYFVFFLFSARSEEKTMLAQFPEQYPAYKRRTKMLIPFVL